VCDVELKLLIQNLGSLAHAACPHNTHTIPLYFLVVLPRKKVEKGNYTILANRGGSRGETEGLKHKALCLVVIRVFNSDFNRGAMDCIKRVQQDLTWECVKLTFKCLIVKMSVLGRSSVRQNT
jgi:hypothetical protein